MGFGSFFKAAYDKATGAAKAVVNTAVGGLKKIPDVGLDAIGHAKSAWDTSSKAVQNVYAKAKERFTGKPPAQPCATCTGKPVDHDGALVGYKDGKCVPLTNKGDPINKDTIAMAKANGYNPRHNYAKDLEHPGDADKNTSDATKSCCEKCTKGKPPRTIFYVNGIQTKPEGHCNTLKRIGDSTCATVVGVYNATEGFPGDTFQTAQDRNLIGAADKGKKGVAGDGRNPAVDSVSTLVVKETVAGNPPEIWAHSQGGAITSLALYDASNTLSAGGYTDPKGNPATLQNVKVNSFGAAAPKWVEGPQYTHYVHKDDPVPTLLGVGEKPAPDVVHFSGKQGDDYAKGPSRIYNIGAHDVNESYLPRRQMDEKANGQCACGKA
jgi:hypothetical protein